MSLYSKQTYLISIHSPHARGDAAALDAEYNPIISIHSPHARGDIFCCWKICNISYFNPLPSCEGRPDDTAALQAAFDISIHSPHARGDWFYIVHYVYLVISIHSPHARGDSINLQKSFWIQGSLYNKNITAHFSKTLKPFYGLKSSCFGCEASRKVMTASPSHGFSEDASHHSMI